MRYLLDSNAVIGLLAHHAAVEKRVLESSVGEVVLSSVVLFELMFGAYNSKRIEENLARLSHVAFPVIDFDADDARAAGEIRARLKRAGTPIGPYDVLIAGQAAVRNLIIVTANGGEFGRVQGLQIEDWSVA